jgi:hypothetical protein
VADPSEHEPQVTTRRERADPARASDVDERKPVVLGLLAAPGLVHDLVDELAGQLPSLLRRRFAGFSWEVEVRVEPRAAASESDVDLIDIARRRMLEEGWTLVICLTDLPLHAGNRPVTAHASATHGVGLVSVPALGAVGLETRVRAAVLRVIEGMLTQRSGDRRRDRSRRRENRMRRHLDGLTSPLGRAVVNEDRTIRFVTDVGRGNVRLLVGMVRANRPWALVAGLSRALAGALGVDIFGLASPGVWLLSDGQSWPRLLVICLISIVVTCVSLVVAHGLWERTDSPTPEARERVTLFNLATTLTVGLGILTLYAALFAINVVAAALLIAPGVLHRQLDHPVGLAGYLALAWLVSSLATLGGALGAALENDRAVRQAAYGYQPDED